MPSDDVGYRDVKPSLVRWAVVSLVLCVTSLVEAQEPSLPHPPAPGKQLPSGYLPSKLMIYVGGGIFPPNYSVVLHGESLIYHVSDIDPKTHEVRETSTVVTPSASQWRQFWKAMEEVDLWRWQPEYADPRIADGTKWGVDIDFAGRTIHSIGSAVYPGAPSRSKEPPKADSNPEDKGKFASYLRAVEELLGGERFR